VAVQAITNAARVLHAAGHPDHALLVFRYADAGHDAGVGLIGALRKVRVREDRGVPRHVPWAPFPVRRVNGLKRDAAPKGTRHRADATSEPPGAKGGETTEKDITMAEVMS
jgi:hypothetical protein